MAADLRKLIEDFQANRLYDDEEMAKAQKSERQRVQKANVREDLDSVGQALYGAFTRTPVAAPRARTPMPSEADVLGQRQRMAGAEQQRQLGLAQAQQGLEEGDARKAAEAEDSKAVQAMLAQTLGPAWEAYPPDVRARANKGNWEMFLHPEKVRQQLEQSKAAAAEKARERAARQAQLTETQRHNRAMEAKSSQRGLGPDGIRERDVQALGKDVEPIAAMSGNVAQLQKLASMPEGEDIPGVGKWDSRKPFFMESDADTDTRQRAYAVVSALLKAQSGAGVTEAEVERKMLELGLGTGQSEQAFRTGISRLAGEVEAQQQRTQAKYRPDVVATYGNRGGPVQAAQRPPAQGGSFEAGGRTVRVSNGTETLEIDAADVADAEADGFRRVP